MSPHSPQAHRKQAEENERFYHEVLGGQNTAWPKWGMVALFYTAVHELQAFMVERGQAPQDHAGRKAVLRKNKFQLGTHLAQQYQALRKSSENARYELWRPTRTDLADAEVRLQKIRDELRQHSSVRTLLAPDPY